MDKNIVESCGFPANTEKAEDLIRSLLLREGDVSGMNYMRYRSVVREVFLELQLDAIRTPRRVILPVDKNTGIIPYPDDLLLPSSVSVWHCGVWHRVPFSSRIMADIKDVSVDAACGCDCGCQSGVCHDIHSYEPIIEVTSEQMPNGTHKDFTSVTRKRVNTDGTMLVERTYPLRKYTNGVWTDTVYQTDTEIICKVDVEPCGCVKNTPQNVQLLDQHSLGGSFRAECGCCPTVMPELAVGVLEQDNALVIPNEFRFDKVLLRYYVVPGSVSSLRIPILARKAFILGMKDAIALFDDGMDQYRIEKFGRLYNAEKEKLIDRQTRWDLNDITDALNPKRQML